MRAQGGMLALATRRRQLGSVGEADMGERLGVGVSSERRVGVAENVTLERGKVTWGRRRSTIVNNASPSPGPPPSHSFCILSSSSRLLDSGSPLERLWIPASEETTPEHNKRAYHSGPV